MHTAVDDRHQGDESSQGDWGGGEVALCRGSQSFTESPQPAAGAGRVRPEEAAGRGCAQELENVAVIWAAQTPAGSLTSLLSPRDVHIICRPSSWSASTSHPARGLSVPGSPPSSSAPLPAFPFQWIACPLRSAKREAGGVCNFRILTPALSTKAASINQGPTSRAPLRVLDGQAVIHHNRRAGQVPGRLHSSWCLGPPQTLGDRGLISELP